MPDARMPPARTALSPGTRLNGVYEIDQLIASGGMGEIYRAHAIQTGDKVAIKMMLPAFATDQAALALFRKEASALHDLHHDAIVRYFVFSVEPTLRRPYLAMEFLEGQALSDLLKRGPMVLEAVVSLMRRVAGGLQAAHERGIVHRDVTPDNIMIPLGADVARAKIIDFGIARSLQAGAQTVIGGGFAGKYNYVSPEQLGLFGGEVTPKSDIYSLGLVLVEALTGRPLDMGGSQVAIIEKRRRVPDLGAIDMRIRPLIDRMLQPDPEDRPDSMAAVAAWPLGGNPGLLRRRDSDAASGQRAKDKAAASAAETEVAKPEQARRRTWLLAGGASAATLALLVGAGAYYLALEPKSALLAPSRPSPGLAPSGMPTAAPSATPGAPSVPPMLQPGGLAPPRPANPPPLSAGVSAPAAIPTPPPAAAAAPAPEPTRPPVAAPIPSSTATPPPGMRPPGTNLPPATAAQPAPAAPPLAGPPVPGGDASPALRPGTPGLVAAAPALAPPPPMLTPAPPGASIPQSAPPAPSLAPPAPSLTPAAPPAISAAPMPGYRPPPLSAPAGGADRPAAPPAPQQPTADTAMLTPQATPAPAPALDRVQKIEDFIARYEGGDCFFIRPVAVSANAAQIEGYGASVAPFQTLDDAFKRSNGFEASIGLRQVTPEQCPAITFLNSQRHTSAQAPRLNLAATNVRSGEVLRGDVSPARSGQHVELLLITDEGAVHNVTALLKPSAAGSQFSMGLQRTGAPGARPQLLLALASAHPLATVRSASGVAAAQLFAQLAGEIAQSRESVAAAARYFKLE
ncbi:MAG TPA: serine/threonine-protein kinase [Xanthobacteraceae bacterium]|nr:serine/threonine-protein kinase [Xanthobacteraceae bacterium]